MRDRLREAAQTTFPDQTICFLFRNASVDRGLFLSDVPAMNDRYAGQDFISDLSMRLLTTQGACGIVKAGFPNNMVDQYLYPSCNGYGVELPAGAAAKMLEYGVIIITTWPISRTDARVAAVAKGIQIASCGDLELNMLMPDNVLETEKIDGTVHIGFDDNAHFGGTISSDYHGDMAMPEPDLCLDGQLVIQCGELL